MINLSSLTRQEDLKKEVIYIYERETRKKKFKKGEESLLLYMKCNQEKEESSFIESAFASETSSPRSHRRSADYNIGRTEGQNMR